MTINEFSRRIELHFWDWAIPTLSQTAWLQKAVCIAAHLKGKFSAIKPIFLLGCVSAAGFFNGMLIFWLVAR